MVVNYQPDSGNRWQWWCLVVTHGSMYQITILVEGEILKFATDKRLLDLLTLLNTQCFLAGKVVSKCCQSILNYLMLSRNNGSPFWCLSLPFRTP